MTQVPLPGDIAKYLDAAPPQARDGLLDLRAQILALLPQAQERIGYQIPVFVAGRQVSRGIR